MKTEVKNFENKEHFEYYNSATIPFVTVTVKIDITNIYNFCKVRGNYYATIGYYFTKALNTVDEFKYSYEDGKFYKYDIIHPSFTDIREDKSIGYYTCDMVDDYDEFISDYTLTKKKFLNGEETKSQDGKRVVWLSCQPWFHFTSLVPPIRREISIPQLIWDKFAFEDNKVYVNLMIMGHHGFVDGYHIGKLVSAIEEVVASIGS